MPDLTREAAILTTAFSPPTAPGTPAPAVARTASPPRDVGPQPEITASEASKMAQWAKEDLKSERITEAQATAIFNDLGTPLEERITEDTRSDEQKLLDRHFPAAEAKDYLIPYFRPGEDATMTPQLKEFDQSARTWLSSAQFPKTLGDSLVTQIARVAERTNGMTESELESYGYAEYAKLERAFGPTLEEKLRRAGQMVEILEQQRPGLKNVLRRVGDNAMVASMLIQQAERWHARRARA